MSDNELSRLGGVLVAPGRTFEAIGARPTWIAALAVLLLAVIGLSVAVHLHTDYREVMEQALAKAGRQGAMSEADVDKMVAMQERFGGIFSIFGGVFAGGIFLLIALVFMVVLRLLGSEITFVQSLAVYLHSAMPAAVMCLIAAPIILAGGDLPYEQLALREFLSSSLSFLAPADVGMPVKALYASVEFFSLWGLVLSAIGYRIVGKVSAGAAWGTAILIWVLGVGLRVGMTVLGGMG